MIGSVAQAAVSFNEEQITVIEAAVDHIENGGGTELVISGPAGTGKSTCVQEILRRTPNKRVVVSAPTNKACRVLREMLEASGYMPPVMTIYRLLGVTMLTNGELKHAGKVGDGYDLGEFDAIFIDEAFMLNEKMVEHVFLAMADWPNIAWIMLGDEYQIPPVGELISKVALLPNKVCLTRVMRTDNQILTLATHVRSLVAAGGGKLEMPDDHDEKGGVYRVDTLREVLLADAEAFRLGTSKGIAWRNVTVDAMNRTIRRPLLEHPDEAPWQVTERITLLERAVDFNDDLIANTDDEATIVSVSAAMHPVYRSVQCWRLGVVDDEGYDYGLWVLHPDGEKVYNAQLEALKAKAYADRPRWKDFWLFKESFHQVRHAYATTSHRAQGSTYTKAYVDRRDILSNRSFPEALRILYVAISRPRHSLYMS